jgi:outer membrane protein W
MMRHRILVALLAAITMLPCARASAQEHQAFVGVVAGISALSADARSITNGSEAAISLYAPKNGPALNVFGGVHLAQYFSAQVNWVWNANDLTLTSSSLSPSGSRFYEQRRHSGQSAVVLDGLVYFRRLDSAIRPYLGTGLAVVHVSTDAIETSMHGLVPPHERIVKTRLGLRSHVGIDVKLTRRVAFRYSFSETITENPISAVLMPAGTRSLANFQNLFGVVGRL